MKKIRVLYHDNCFDGVSSAAVFSRFYRRRIDPGAEIEYEGLTHKAGQHIGDEQFGEGENAMKFGEGETIRARCRSYYFFTR